MEESFFPSCSYWRFLPSPLIHRFRSTPGSVNTRDGRFIYLFFFFLIIKKKRILSNDVLVQSLSTVISLETVKSACFSLFIFSIGMKMSASLKREKEREKKKACREQLDIGVLLVSRSGIEISSFETKIRSSLSIIFASNFCSFAVFHVSTYVRTEQLIL